MLDWFKRRWFATGPTLSPPRRASIRLRVEALESRELLSASALPTAQTALQLGPLVTSPTPYGYTPAEIREAYGFNQIRFGSVVGNGRGQTIAIIDAYNDPYIASDLHTFDEEYGLPNPPSFTKVNEYGGTNWFPAASTSWSLEMSLDVEWAHAMAPQANILLVEASTSGLGDLLTAVAYATSVPSVSVVSMSWGTGEFWSETYYDSYFTTPAGHQAITFVAASGDSGAPANWPAVSPNVVAVGGTNLYLGADGIYGSESGWYLSGGGISQYESPALGQHAMVPGETDRTAPDVAYDANPYTGFSIYDTMGYEGWTGWLELGGTSAGAPQWAGLIAIANQGRALHGLGTLDGPSQTLPALYAMPNSAFHQILTGGNIYGERIGYNYSTGRGTPYANVVVQDLVAVGASTDISAGSLLRAVEAGFALPHIGAPILSNGSGLLGVDDGRALTSAGDSSTFSTPSEHRGPTRDAHPAPMSESPAAEHARNNSASFHAFPGGPVTSEADLSSRGQPIAEISNLRVEPACGREYRRAPVFFDVHSGTPNAWETVQVPPQGPLDSTEQPIFRRGTFEPMAAASLVALGLSVHWDRPDEDRHSRA